jgi:hypothetical protein
LDFYAFSLQRQAEEKQKNALQRLFAGRISNGLSFEF